MHKQSSRQSGNVWVMLLVLALVGIMVGLAIYFILTRMHTAVTADFVTHPPGATVWVDGRLIEGQKTPITGHVVVFGSTDTVVVHVQKEGYRPWTRHLTPAELGALTSIELEPDVAAATPPVALVDVITDPAGAEVFIDGEKAGTSPVTSYALAPGTGPVRIEARHDGFEAASTAVARDRLTTDPVVTLALKPLPVKQPSPPEPAEQAAPKHQSAVKAPRPARQPRPPVHHEATRPAERPREPETMIVRVEGRPAGARVAINGRTVAPVTPFEFRARKGEDLAVDVWLPGYERFRRRYSASEIRATRLIRYTLHPVVPSPAPVRSTPAPPAVAVETPKPSRAAPQPVATPEPVPPRPAPTLEPRVATLPATPRPARQKPVREDVVEQRMTLASEPPGAEVFVNGESVGQATLKNFLVRTRGDITVVMRHPGYKEASRTFSLRDLSRPVTWKARLELLPLDPNTCADEDGQRWLERLSGPDPITDYEVLRNLRACFQQHRNWKGVLAVTDRALVHDVYGGLGVDYYARAVALKELGGTGNFKLCAEAARLAATKKTGLDQIDVWEVWYLELYCLYGYLNRSRTDISGRWDDPKELEYQLKARYMALKNDIANKKDTLPRSRQAEAGTIESNLATLRKEMGW